MNWKDIKTDNLPAMGMRVFVSYRDHIGISIGTVGRLTKFGWHELDAKPINNVTHFAYIESPKL